MTAEWHSAHVHYHTGDADTLILDAVRPLVEQLGCERSDVSKDLAFELCCFVGRRFDAAGEASQHQPCRELVWLSCARAAQTAAVADQPLGRQATQLLA